MLKFDKRSSKPNPNFLNAHRSVGGLNWCQLGWTWGGARNGGISQACKQMNKARGKYHHRCFMYYLCIYWNRNVFPPSYLLPINWWIVLSFLIHAMVSSTQYQVVLFLVWVILTSKLLKPHNQLSQLISWLKSCFSIKHKFQDKIPRSWIAEAPLTNLQFDSAMQQSPNHSGIIHLKSEINRTCLKIKLKQLIGNASHFEPCCCNQK